MKRLLIYGCCAIISNFCVAQKTVDVDKDQTTGINALNHYYTVSGTPFVMTKFSRVVEGTPFFKEEMMKGAIILSGGREYRHMQIRLNLLDQKVNYVDEKRTEIVATTPIREVVLWDTIYNTDFRFVNSDYIDIKSEKKPEKDFYELLHAGKAELYKQHKKLMSETRPYGSATYEQRIDTHTLFFVLYDGSWVKIRRLKDLPGILADKTKELNQFISDNKLSGDNELNFKSVVGFYNSLFIKPA